MITSERYEYFPSWFHRLYQSVMKLCSTLLKVDFSSLEGSGEDFEKLKFSGLKYHTSRLANPVEWYLQFASILTQHMLNVSDHCHCSISSTYLRPFSEPSWTVYSLLRPCVIIPRQVINLCRRKDIFHGQGFEVPFTLQIKTHL